MRIEASQLESVFEKTILKLKELGIDHVDLRQDYYLNIPEWQKVEEFNQEPNVGSLVDDWENLEKVGAGGQPMMFVDFERLSAILRAIGDELDK